MKIFINVYVATLLASCQPNNTSQYTYSKVDSSLQYSDSQNSEKEFDSFLKKVSVDTAYQLSRIKFPLLVKKLTEDGEEELSKLESDKWEHMNFDSVVGVQREILSPNELVRNVRYFDPEVALEVIYVFHKLQEKWFLLEIIDNSN